MYLQLLFIVCPGMFLNLKSSILIIFISSTVSFLGSLSLWMWIWSWNIMLRSLRLVYVYGISAQLCAVVSQGLFVQRAECFLEWCHRQRGSGPSGPPGGGCEVLQPPPGGPHRLLERQVRLVITRVFCPCLGERYCIYSGFGSGLCPLLSQDQDQNFFGWLDDSNVEKTSFFSQNKSKFLLNYNMFSLNVQKVCFTYGKTSQ